MCCSAWRNSPATLQRDSGWQFGCGVQITEVSAKAAGPHPGLDERNIRDIEVTFFKTLNELDVPPVGKQVDPDLEVRAKAEMLACSRYVGWT